MTGVLQQIADGLSTGAIYASLALALVLVNRATGVINFAQGTMGTFGAFLAWTAWSWGVPIWPAVIIAIVLSVPFGAVVERYVVRRLYGQNTLAIIIITVGMLVALTGIIGTVWGYHDREFPALFPSGVLRIGGVALSYAAIGNLIVLIIVVILMQVVFLKTRFGLAMRSVADNRDSSSLLGLPTSGLLMAGWGMAAALGTLAACLIAPEVFLGPTMMDTVLIYALTAAILGGLDSPLGAVVAALGIGVAENLAGAYISFIGTDMKIVVPLALMAVILLLKPQGLFGHREVVRV